jgi:hypothetical protein
MDGVDENNELPAKVESGACSVDVELVLPVT